MKPKAPPQLSLELDVAPAGLRYLPEFVTDEEASELLARLRTLPLRHVIVHGQVAKRTIARLGVGRSGDEAAAPIPAWLAPVTARVATAMGARPETLESLIVLRYPPGARLGWNRDRAHFGPTLAELTLGGGVQLRLRTARAAPDGGRATHALDAAPRSLLVLGGAARRDWQYMLQPRDGDDGERWAISWRTLTRR